MPIYEYRCPQGHLFEVFHGMSEAGPQVCEECGQGPIERVLHPVAVHFKGSGFYSTDYGRGGTKRKEGAKEEGGSKDDSGSGSSETKTAAAEAS